MASSHLFVDSCVCGWALHAIDAYQMVVAVLQVCGDGCVVTVLYGIG